MADASHLTNPAGRTEQNGEKDQESHHRGLRTREKTEGLSRVVRGGQKGGECVIIE